MTTEPKKPEDLALQLARLWDGVGAFEDKTAAELRRLHARVAELERLNEAERVQSELRRLALHEEMQKTAELELVLDDMALAIGATSETHNTKGENK